MCSVCIFLNDADFPKFQVESMENEALSDQAMLLAGHATRCHQPPISEGLWNPFLVMWRMAYHWGCMDLPWFSILYVCFFTSSRSSGMSYPGVSPCAFGHCSGSTFLRTGMLLKRMKETAMTRMFRDVGMRCRKDVMAKMDQTSSVACELSFEN